MRNPLIVLMLLALALLALPQCPLLAQEQPPPADAPPADPAETPASPEADAMLAQINKMTPPAPDPAKRDDAAYMAKFKEEYMAAMKKRAELAKQFYDRYPTHAGAPDMLNMRWSMLMSLHDFDTISTETKQVIAASSNPKLVSAARFSNAQAVLFAETGDFATKSRAVEDFISNASKEDERGGVLLMQLASNAPDATDEQQLALYRRILADYPDARSAKSAASRIKQFDSIGKPFVLAFNDAITGKPISMTDYKGKVVVVDFWATWCGPCVAEMPKMKDLYSQYRDKGVEFIGVSLDHPVEKGGLDALKKFVAENSISWPQYYQGKFWDSEFSKGWGIDSIPAVFIVDANGNLYSTKARGKLDKMIPELLAKRDGKEARSN